MTKQKTITTKPDSSPGFVVPKGARVSFDLGSNDTKMNPSDAFNPKHPLNANSFKEYLISLHQAYQSIEEGLVTNARDAVYHYLSKCLEIIEISSDKQNIRLAVVDEFLAKQGVECSADDTLTQKVVYAVFGNIPKPRLYAYQKVLKTAYANGVKSKQLVNWIKSQGGTEVIRLATSADKTKALQSSSQAISVSADDALNFMLTEASVNVMVQNDRLTSQTSVDEIGRLSAIICTRMADGQYKLHFAIHDKSLTARAMSVFAKKHHLDIIRYQVRQEYQAPALSA